MSKLSREQIERSLDKIAEVYEWERVVSYLRDRDDALRARCEQAEQECQHFRSACASIGETDGHGWAETTKELRQRVADMRENLAAMTEKQRSCEAAFNGYIQETAHALSPDDPCVATTTEQIIELKQQLAASEQECLHLRTLKVSELNAAFVMREGQFAACKQQLADSEQRLSEELDKRHAVVQQLTASEQRVADMQKDAHYK